MRKSPWLCLVLVFGCSPSTPENELGDVGPIGGDRSGGGDPAIGGDHASGGDPTGSTNDCGNNQINGLEACDGTAFRVSPDCSVYSAGTGQVTCTQDCLVDFAGCSGDTCQGLGWYNDGGCDPCHRMGGTRDPDCDANCGANGVCANYHEFLFGDWTCLLAGLTWDPDCDECGNGTASTIANFGEYCDGGDLKSQGCSDWGYDGGSLSCRADCSFNFSACTLVNGGPVCGDESFSGIEECDPPETFLCTDVNAGFGSGSASCTNQCRFDFSSCAVSDICQVLGWYSDGRCDPCPLLGGSRDADCDGCSADGTCVDRYSPTARRWGCEYDGSADPDCGVCGDNVGDEFEFCDGVDLRGQDCTDWDFTSGVLACNADCTLNFSRCIP